MIDKFLKYAPLLSLLSLISLLVGGIYFFGGFMVMVKEGLFTPTEKVEIQRHVKESISPAQQQRKYILDSINTVSAIKSRKERDSLGKIRDSINVLNADQLFQIKKAIKKAHPNN